MATVSPPFTEFLPPWLATQRWYSGKGSTEPRLTRIGGLRFEDPDGEVGIETWLVRDTSGEEPVVYQVPLTYRDTPLAGAEHALVAQVQHSELGTRWIYDGCHDPVAAKVLLETILSAHTVDSDGPPGTGSATGHPTSGDIALDKLRLGESRVLRGEQSNTSIIFPAVGTSPPLMCKVFRVLHRGDNPDVVVPRALAATGSARVPRPVGDLYGTWPDNSAMSSGHLAVAQEFISGARDGWRRAVDAAVDGVDFTAAASSLGAAIGEVHTMLRQAFDVEAPSDARRAELAATWQRRADAAMREVPELAHHARDIASVFESGAQAPWPELQRLHGDLHLGQVIDAGQRGWLLLDFEGEPLRPLPERNVRDLALRDVAGMLRSFDYAAGAARRSHRQAPGPPAHPQQWAERSRTAFLEGYGTTTGQDPQHSTALLHALELDKALYESLYEARNRPDWLMLPLEGVARLLERPGEDLPPGPR